MALTDKSLFPPHPPSKPRPNLCPLFCNPTKNFLRACPPPCFLLCPSFCQLVPSPQPPPPPPPPPPINHPRHQHDHLSPVFISMIVLLASSFAIVISYLIYSAFFSSSPRRQQHRRGSGPELDQSLDALNFHPVWYIATVGLQRSTIESIGVLEYSKGDGLVQGTSCVVCLSEFQDGDSLRLLPKCCHAFHVPCIDTWFASHTTCPVCRSPVLLAENSGFRQDQGVVEIVDEPSLSGREVGEEGEGRRPMRRAASMDRLGVEVGNKMNSGAASGSNSLGERSLSCTGKLFSSSRGGLT